jgi:MFS family permease
LCLFLSRYILEPSPEGLLIYPLAFSILVLAKGYSIAKSSLVPSLVDDEGELVRANSRLALISVIATAVGGAPAFGIQQLLGSDWSLILAMAVFGTAAAFAMKIPRVALAPRPVEETELEREELHLPSILLAGSAMAMMRAAVGFLAFFTAFALRKDLVGLGIAAGCGMTGSFAGNLVAPMLRQRMREESMLVTAMLTTTALVVLGFVVGGVFGFAISGFAVGVGAAAGKLGFDSLLQRDGPDAVRGRAFARFETRFQLAWVIGSLLGIIPIDRGVGLLVLGLTIGFAGLSYLAALRAAHGRVYRTTIRPKVVDDLYGKAKSEVTTAWGRRNAKRRRRPAGTRRTMQDDDTIDDRPRRPSRRRR